MNFERSYRSYEEFEREELRKMERLDVSFEELLSEFDTTDDRAVRRKDKRDGLFDAYDDEDFERRGPYED